MSDEYLKEDYSIITCADHLKTCGDIEDYFGESGREGYELFECGQGFYTAEADAFVGTADGKFYEVKLTADIESSKQDRGDRLYWVECIASVAFKEVPKPGPIPRTKVKVEVEIKDTESARAQLERHLESSEFCYEARIC